MLGQTIVAGWYMKGIMPYQGWSFVDLDEILHQPLLGHRRCAVCAADQHPDPVRDPVLLGVGGFLDRTDGLPRAAHRSRQVPHFRQKRRQRADSAEARTALVMPICNEDVPRVFAGLRATFESVAPAATRSLRLLRAQRQ
jgi:membrane glycosyltransferase